ncbi:MAG: TerD family protein [Blastocatellia bacterium]
MGVSLQKGQRVDLTKGNEGLSKILIGLGWDPIKQSGGFFSSLFGGAEAQIDCDASVFMLGDNGRVAQLENVIYYGNLTSPCGSIRHQGDNLTGQGDGDDEQIIVNLSQIPSTVNKLVFTVSIYDSVNRKQHFGMIQNCFIRLVDSLNNKELMKFNLTENFSGRTSLIVGEIYRHQDNWKFAAIGEGTTDDGINGLAKRYLSL